jgi:hypothetical protein
LSDLDILFVNAKILLHVWGQGSVDFMKIVKRGAGILLDIFLMTVYGGIPKKN